MVGYKDIWKHAGCCLMRHGKPMPDKCICGKTPQIKSHALDGVVWYFIECQSCGMRTSLEFNYAELSIDSWNNGETINGLKDGLYNYFSQN